MLPESGMAEAVEGGMEEKLLKDLTVGQCLVE
jgi:hypothetical protein